MHIVDRVDNFFSKADLSPVGVAALQLRCRGVFCPQGGLVGGTTETLLIIVLLVVSLESCCFNAESSRGGEYQNKCTHILTAHIMETYACTHRHKTCTLTTSPSRIQHPNCPASPIHVCVRALGCTPAFFFLSVGLIKADTVQSRGLGGEIKALLLARRRRGGK